MKLELNHLAPYLPYGLKVQYEGIINGAELKQWEKEFSDRYEINGTYPTRPYPEAIIGNKVGFIKRIEFRKNGSPSFLIGNKVGKRYYDLEGIKPLLLPLSALYEEIDGEIGIVEIAKILSGTILVDKIEGACRNLAYFRCTFEDGIEELIINQRCEGWYRSYFDKNQPNTGRNVVDQYEVFEYLFSHHYDVFDLCSKGIAIDKRSVTKPTL